MAAASTNLERPGLCGSNRESLRTIKKCKKQDLLELEKDLMSGEER